MRVLSAKYPTIEMLPLSDSQIVHFCSASICGVGDISKCCMLISAVGDISKCCALICAGATFYAICEIACCQDGAPVVHARVGAETRQEKTICIQKPDVESVEHLTIIKEQVRINAVQEKMRIRVAMDSGDRTHVIHHLALPAGIDVDPNATGKHFAGAALTSLR